MFWCVLPLFFRAYFLPVFEHELHRFAHLLLLSACLHGGEHRPSLFSLDAYKVFYRMALRSFVFRRVVCLLAIRSNAVENIPPTDCVSLRRVRGFLRQGPRSGIPGSLNEKSGKQKPSNVFY